MKEIADIIRFWEARAGDPFALATLVSTKGSSFRLRGARMLIHADGARAGGLSAGCIEDEVARHAREVMVTGRARLVTFDTRLRYGCHGTIGILVEPLPAGLMPELSEHFRARRPCRLLTRYAGEYLGTRALEFEAGDDEGFTQWINPAIRLLLLGDGAESLALEAQAALLGWEVRQVEAEEFSADLVDARTAVVLATHNYGRDYAALRQLLPLPLNYLGLVGSRRRRDDLLFDVLQDGLSVNASLFAPVGLHLGADSPEEIALSIAAEIQAVFTSGTAQHLRAWKAPIHHREPTPTLCEKSVD
jgi:xanthine dehydrogenase accessory factor